MGQGGGVRSLGRAQAVRARRRILRVGQAGQGPLHLGPPGKVTRQPRGAWAQLGLFGGQRLGLVHRARPFAPGLRAPGRGGKCRKRIADAVAHRIHPPAARHHIDLARDRRQQVAPRGKPLIARAPFIGAAAIRFHPQHALTHPQKARWPRQTAAHQPVDPGLGLISLRDQATSPVGNLRLCPLQPALRDAEAALGQVHLHGHLGRPPGMGLQGLDLGVLAAVPFEEQGMDRIEEGGLAEFVRLGQHGDAVANARQAGAASGEAAHVRQFDRPQLHARTSCASA
jgi:hypothetical protein